MSYFSFYRKLWVIYCRPNRIPIIKCFFSLIIYMFSLCSCVEFLQCSLCMSLIWIIENDWCKGLLQQEWHYTYLLQWVKFKALLVGHLRVLVNFKYHITIICTLKNKFIISVENLNVKKSNSNSWKHIKLYFVINMPLNSTVN